MTRLAIAQVGAPTAVVNASLFGFLRGAGPCEVLGSVGGPTGLLRGDLRPLRLGVAGQADPGHRGDLVLGADVADRPGAWLGAGRHPFTEAELEAVVDRLTAAGVDGVALVGGDGTMVLAHELHRRAVRRRRTLSVVGVPKTVDNDITGTDHAPGFPSAARFGIQAVAALAVDQQAMASIEPVRVVETLGRRTGWLAMATVLARPRTGGAPHLVYVPERPFDDDRFLADVGDALARHGHVLAVVAEGVADPSVAGPFDRPVYDRPLHGGVAHRLTALVEARLGVGSRAEVLGLVQRCAWWAVSPTDRDEAAAAGAEGAHLLRQGVGGVMVSLPKRRPGAAPGGPLPAVPLEEVAGRSRAVPPAWVPAAGDEAPGFAAWLDPLVGDVGPEAG